MRARFWPGWLTFAIASIMLPSRRRSGPVRKSEAVSVALRWTLTGRYAEHGLYGKPTGARLFLLGATHLDMIGDRIVEEWTVFDELAVLAQVAGALGAAS